MCNLYNMVSNIDAIRRLFAPIYDRPMNLPLFDEIYPRGQAPVITANEGVRSLSLMNWGVPLPQRDKAPKFITNVRNLESPLWRGFLKDPANRCLVPATSFCEWTDSRPKRKIWFSLEETEIFAFAGLWRRWTGVIKDKRQDLNVFAFLVCEPNGLVEPVHAKGMPVILKPDDYDAWLTGTPDRAARLQRPFPAEEMCKAEPAEPADDQIRLL